MEHSIPERIAGEGFFLRRWEVEDAAWYVTARDEEIFQWTTENRALTILEAEDAIRRINKSPAALCFAVVDQRTRELLGNIALAFKEASPKTAEIMFWLAPVGRGRGVATMAVKLLCNWAFQSIGLERITLKTKHGNIRSRRVAEQAGFRLVSGEPEEGSHAEYLWFERSRGRVDSEP